jgi:hypothetical protein
MLNAILTRLQRLPDRTPDYIDSEVHPTRPTRWQKVRSGLTVVRWLLSDEKPIVSLSHTPPVMDYRRARGCLVVDVEPLDVNTRFTARALLTLESNGGNMKRTARETGIPLTTIRNWRDGGGVSDDVAIIGNEKRPELLERMMTELHAVMDLMPDKRPDADYNALVRAAGILTDKVQLLQGKPTERIVLTHELSDEDLERIAAGRRD